MENRTPNNAAIYSIAWPLGMNLLLQQTIFLIDTMLVGGLGDAPLAAMGIATSITGLILGVLFALCNGTQILVAQAFGADQHTALKSGFWSGLIVGLFVAAFGVTLIVLFRESIINRLTENADIAFMASSYLLVSTIYIVGLAISQNISVFLYATDNPKIPLYSKLMELPFNAVVSYVLIYGVWGMPELGVAGAAVGSVAAVLLRCLYLIWYLIWNNNKQRFSFLLSPGWNNNSISASIKNHLSNALPIAGTFISINFAITITMMIYSQLAVVEFAAFTVLFIWIRLSGLLANSWSQAVGIWVGRLLGQNRSNLLGDFVFSAWKVMLVISLVITVIYSLTPLFFSILYPKLSDEAIDVVRTILPALVLMPWIRSSNTICGNVLRAAGQAGYAFKVHVTVQWLFTVPMTALFVLVLDLSVLWVFSIIVFEELLKAIPFHSRIMQGSWKTSSLR